MLNRLDGDEQRDALPGREPQIEHGQQLQEGLYDSVDAHDPAVDAHGIVAGVHEGADHRVVGAVKDARDHAGVGLHPLVDPEHILEQVHGILCEAIAQPGDDVRHDVHGHLPRTDTLRRKPVAPHPFHRMVGGFVKLFFEFL